jgi:flagellar hook assembly protein FlgD
VNALPGQYQVDVSLVKNGKSTAGKALLYTKVHSVSMNGSDVMLNLVNGETVSLSQVSTMR